MANVSRPQGLKPVKHITGAPYNGQANLYYRPATEAEIISVGDCVTLGGSADADGIASVAKVTAGGAATAILGVVVGVVVAKAGVSLQGTTIDLTRRSLAASTEGYLLVCDDPNIVYEVQAGVAVGVAGIGSNANLTVANPSQTYQDSATVISTAALVTYATADVKILSAVQLPTNDITLADAKVLVRLNNTQLSNGTAGV